MVMDKDGQGLIDFTEMFSPNSRSSVARSSGLRRKQVKPEDRVPQEEVIELNTVMTRSGLRQKDVCDRTGLTPTFVSKVLSFIQPVNREDFDLMFKAAAKLVFRKIAEA